MVVRVVQVSSAETIALFGRLAAFHAELRVKALASIVLELGHRGIELGSVCGGGELCHWSEFLPGGSVRQKRVSHAIPHTVNP